MLDGLSRSSPTRAIEHAWGGTLAITIEPDARASSGSRPASTRRRATRGTASRIATLAGKLMAEAVQGTAERFDVFAGLPQPRFPGGAALRWPLLVLAMSWYAMRDRL